MKKLFSLFYFAWLPAFFFCSELQAQLSSSFFISRIPASTSVSGYRVLTDAEANAIIAERQGNVRYVDFHIHTTFKNYYNHIKSPSWLDQQLPGNTALSLINWSGVNKEPNEKFNHFKSYRQADFGILEHSNASMLATSISPIEKRMVCKDKALLGFSMRFINKVLVSHLPMRRLKTLYNKNNSSYDEFRAELKFLLDQQTGSPDGLGYEVGAAKNKDELIANFRKGKTSLVISLEGAHNLHGKTISANETLTKKPLQRIFSNTEMAEYLENVDSLKSLPYRVFFMTPGHFAWNGVVGSAKTLDMEKFRWLLMSKSRLERFRKKLFYKPADGIIGYVYNNPPQKNKSATKLEKDNSKELLRQDKGMKKPDICDCVREAVPTQDLGWKTIRKLLDTTGGKAPIFIDVKHMDIKARYDYYHFLDTGGYKHVPIIASHVAASGEDFSLAWYSGLCPVYDVYQEVANTQKWYDLQGPAGFKCINPDAARKETVDWFYPWSINLADEEIPIIYNSDGIIGIALEERVIGTGRPNYKKHEEELIRFMHSKNYRNKDSISIFNKMQPLFRNIFYFIEKSGRSDASAWDHLSFGSDFDGIARPVSFCKTAAEIPTLHSLLIEFLPRFIEYAGKSTLTFGLTPKEIADKLVFENGERFMLKYF